MDARNAVGVFAINQLDAARLQRGLVDLKRRAPERAARVRQRARAAMARLSPEFPGDLVSGILYEGENAGQQFADFANDEPCPALDPETGNCELYESRPMTCRVFGPPVRSEDGLGVCELCYHGASEKEIAALEMIPDPDDLESALEDLRKVLAHAGLRLLRSVWQPDRIRIRPASSQAQPSAHTVHPLLSERSPAPREHSEGELRHWQ